MPPRFYFKDHLPQVKHLPRGMAAQECRAAVASALARQLTSRAPRRVEKNTGFTADRETRITLMLRDITEQPRPCAQDR